MGTVNQDLFDEKKRKGVVRKPILSHGFNARGQIDLINFQTCADGEYNWLLNYQDHATKFVHLRSLKSKHAAKVAQELAKNFFTFGAPSILQSDNGREFVAEVIEELVKIWPHCKIVHGRPRYPQSQSSVERGANGDVKTMSTAWMIDRKSTNWSQGYWEVQWMKNTARHRVINRAPYEAALGPIHCGLASLCLPDNVVKDLHTEEDLKKAPSQFNETIPEQSSQGGCDIDQENDQCSESLSSKSTVDNDDSTSCISTDVAVC